MDLLEFKELTRTCNNFLTQVLKPLFIDNSSPSRQHYYKKAKNQYTGEFDLRVEDKFLIFLEKYFPGECVVSEEAGGLWPPGDETTWLLDPVDGSHNSLAGIPLYGSMLVLIKGKIVVFSAIFLPLELLFKKKAGLYISARGLGAWTCDQSDKLSKLVVSSESQLKEAFILLEGPSKKLIDFAAKIKITQKSKRNRIGLSACWTMTRVALGGLYSRGIDGAIALDNQPWDNLPGCLLIEEAGGKVTDFKGRPWSIENCRNLVLSNGLLHGQVLEILQNEPC